MADGGAPEAEPRLPGVPVEVRQQLLDKLHPALEGLVEEDKQPEVLRRLLTVLQARVSVTQTTEVTEMRHHSGRVPPADEIAQYEQVKPGYGDRLFEMAERGQQAEIDSYRDVNRRTDRYQLLALGAGFFGLIIILGFAYALAMQGHDWVAGGALGIGVSGIIATLVNAPFAKWRGRSDEPATPPAPPEQD